MNLKGNLTYKFQLANAGWLIRNAEFNGANWSVNLDLIDKQNGAAFLVAKLCPEKTADEV